MAFEAILSQPAKARAPSRRRQITLTCSVLCHALALAFGLAASIWEVTELPLPAMAVTLAMAPPPPPAPPPRSSPSSKPKTKPVPKPKAIVAPKQAPAPEPEPAADNSKDDDSKLDGEDKGREDGELGGVAGGVSKGVAPPPVAQSTGPHQLSAHAGNDLLAINPNVRPYRVNPPEDSSTRMGTGDTITSVLDICVTVRGTVQSVTIVQASVARDASLARMIDLQIPTVIGRWRYKPYLVDGQPKPFCYLTKYSVKAD